MTSIKALSSIPSQHSMPLIPVPMPQAVIPHVMADSFEGSLGCGAGKIEGLLASDQNLVRGGLLQAHSACFFRAAQTAPKGIVLAFHGFTTGPWQYFDLAEKLNADGFHFFSARSAGHGHLLNGQEDASFLPTSQQAMDYRKSAETALDAVVALAKAQELPVHVFGFSGGGAMALDLTHRHSEDIDRCLLLAPFIKQPKRKLACHLFSVFNRLDYFGIMSKLVDRIPYGWGSVMNAQQPVHQLSSLGNFFGLFRFAHETAPATLSVPTQFILSDLDEDVCDQAARQLFQASGGEAAGHAFFSFTREEGVPHSLYTEGENPAHNGYEKIHQIARDFFSSSQSCFAKASQDR